MKGEPPTGIIRTLPKIYASPRSKAHKNFHACMKALNENPDNMALTCSFALPSKPKQDILHVYILIAGQIRYRFNFVGYYEDAELTCWDGTKVKAAAWTICVGPVETPPRPIERTGFRGFRYTHALW